MMLAASNVWAQTARRIVDSIVTSKIDWWQPRDPNTGAHAHMTRATIAALTDGWSIPEVKNAWQRSKTWDPKDFEAALKKTSRLARRLETPSQNPDDYTVHATAQGHLVVPNEGPGKAQHVLAGFYCRCRSALSRMSDPSDCVHVKATKAYLALPQTG